MSLLAVLVLLWTGLTVNSEKHSLTYIYTALSKPVGLPGIHEFTVIGLLDGKKIDYFDSTTQMKVPTQSWMKERLSEDYWQEGTRSCLRKQLWFKDYIDMLMKRMGQNDTDVHVLQWMHGCEGQVGSDGKFKFLRGINRYGYDGEDFLYFNYTHSVWVASVVAAEETKKKWDEVQVLKEHTKAYMENECMEWLEKFVDYGKEQLREAAPPEIYLYARNSKVETNIILTCLATGFYPKDIVLNIKRDDRILTKDDGVQSSGVRPNNDETFQRLDHVEILKKDKSRFTCEVENLASRVHVGREWDQTLPESGGLGLIIGVAVGGILVVVVVVPLVVFRKRIFDAPLEVISPTATNVTPSENMTLITEKWKGSGDSLDSNVSRNNDGNSGVGAAERELEVFPTGSGWSADYLAGYKAGYTDGSLAGSLSGSAASSAASSNASFELFSPAATNVTPSENMTLITEKWKERILSTTTRGKTMTVGGDATLKPPTPESQGLLESKEGQTEIHQTHQDSFC